MLGTIFIWNAVITAAPIHILRGAMAVRRLRLLDISNPNQAEIMSSDRSGTMKQIGLKKLVFTSVLDGGGGIGHDEALQAAQAFATSRVSEFQGMSLIKDTTGDHGAAGKLYSFIWADRLGSQQAIGVKRVAITVDAGSGVIQSFLQTPTEGIVVNVEPTVSRDQALVIAQKQFGEATISQNATLDVWWRDNDRTQPQLLRWTVSLDSNVPLNANAEANQLIFKHVAYIIDAHTGDIIEELQ
jgi:Zn-dependent metalloprotease